MHSSASWRARTAQHILTHSHTHTHTHTATNPNSHTQPHTATHTHTSSTSTHTRTQPPQLVQNHRTQPRHSPRYSWTACWLASVAPLLCERRREALSPSLDKHTDAPARMQVGHHHPYQTALSAMATRTMMANRCRSAPLPWRTRLHFWRCASAASCSALRRTCLSTPGRTHVIHNR